MLEKPLSSRPRLAPRCWRSSSRSRSSQGRKRSSSRTSAPDSAMRRHTTARPEMSACTETMPGVGSHPQSHSAVLASMVSCACAMPQAITAATCAARVGRELPTASAGSCRAPIPRIVTSPPSTDHDTPAAAEPADLGFGRVVAQAVRGRFLNRDGRPNSVKYGLGAQRAARFYLSALDASWPAFIGWMMGVLLLMNGVFALAYLALGNGALRGTESLGLA